MKKWFLRLGVRFVIQFLKEDEVVELINSKMDMPGLDEEAEEMIIVSFVDALQLVLMEKLN